MADIVNVGGGENWDSSYAGGGPADSVAQVVRAIEHDDMFSLATNTAVASMDLLGVLESPMKSIAGSVVGWLLEHIEYLDGFLDYTAGDPDAITDAVQAFQKASADLDTIAAEHYDSLSQVPTYQEGGSTSYHAFFDNLMPRADEIKAYSLACRGQASSVALAGMVVSFTRGIIRDALTELVLFLIQRGMEAIAAAPYTGGNSVIWATYEVGRRAVLTAQDLSAELTKLTQKLVKASEGTTTLKVVLEVYARNAVPSVARAADQSIDNPDLTKADAAKARHEQPEPTPSTKPTIPWRVQGTLDDG